MRRVKVKLLPRKPGRKSDLKRKRREGWLPVEIYGKGVENKHAWINVKDFASCPTERLFLLRQNLTEKRGFVF
nr:hypothetical protein [Aquifex aeolicus]